VATTTEAGAPRRTVAPPARTPGSAGCRGAAHPLSRRLCPGRPAVRPHAQGSACPAAPADGATARRGVHSAAPAAHQES
jgi:hypothetical protein